MTETNDSHKAVFNVERVYCKDISFEAPGVPHAFLEQSAPSINIQLNINHGVLDEGEGLYEVVLTATATAKQGDKTLFLVEVQQAGVFRMQHIPEADLPKLLEIAGPNILLPFAREAIADLVTKGGFPQLLLNPVNFEALFHQKQAAQKKQAQH